MLASDLRYSELEAGITNHDLFNYHLKELQVQQLIQKNDAGGYELTPQGRQQVALFEEDGTSQTPYKVGLFIALIRQNNDKTQMYLFKRKKHPHYGYSGDITAKLKWGTSLEENLQRELEEELGIQATKFDLLGTYKKTFRDEQGKVMGEGVYFQYVVTEFVGTPSASNIEGEYYWCDIDEILKQENIFRESLEFSVPRIKQYLALGKVNQFTIEQGSKLKY